MPKKRRFEEYISVGDRVLVHSLLSSIWDRFLKLPDNPRPGTVVSVYGHGVYEVQLDIPYTPVFGVIRKYLSKL